MIHILPSQKLLVWQKWPKTYKKCMIFESSLNTLVLLCFPMKHLWNILMWECRPPWFLEKFWTVHVLTLGRRPPLRTSLSPSLMRAPPPIKSRDKKKEGLLSVCLLNRRRRVIFLVHVHQPSTGRCVAATSTALRRALGGRCHLHSHGGGGVPPLGLACSLSKTRISHIVYQNQRELRGLFAGDYLFY